MGRAMIIICAAVLVSLGIVSLSTSNQGQLLTEKAARYANEMKAKNAAHTAIQIAMQRINGDPNWIENHDSETEAWSYEVEGAKTSLYIETLGHDPSANEFFEEDSLRIISKAEIGDAAEGETTFEATVSSLYLKQPFSTLVPPFTSALQVPSDQVNVEGVDGSASISGMAPTDTPADMECEDKPAITVASETIGADFENATQNADMEGTKNVNVDTSLSYQPTDELIARLSNTPDAITLPEGTYDGPLGTASDPGIFFVDKNTKIKGNTEGYGILVVQSSGSLDNDSAELDLKGTFDFHGLVIFENALALDAKGTPTIHGSMLIGNTEDYEGDPLNIDIGGNVNIQYDCRGENYAKKAAAQAVEQHKYTRVVTFEETGFSSPN